MGKLHFYIDEAGRGPLAGPLAVGVVLALKQLKKADCAMFFDSKKLSEKAREKLFEELERMEERGKIMKAIGFVSAKEIDKWGMTKAQRVAIERGIKEILSKKYKMKNDAYGKNGTNLKTLSDSLGVISLAQKDDFFLSIDGNRDFGLKKEHPKWEIETIIKGDDKIKEISMASILAKVSRDRLMRNLGKKYTRWNFAKHKGYGTKEHYRLIEQYGITDQHRKLFLKGIHLAS